LGWFSESFNKKIDKLDKLLEQLLGKDVDLSSVMIALEEIKNKEYPENNNYEILEKLSWLEEKDDKSDIISTLKSNNANSHKERGEHRELMAKLVEQVGTDREMIKKLQDYINMLIKRWDVKKDDSFKWLISDVKVNENDIKIMLLGADKDFISLLDK
jgi:glutamine synthetase adenylyltransferase